MSFWSSKIYTGRAYVFFLAGDEKTGGRVEEEISHLPSPHLPTSASRHHAPRDSPRAPSSAASLSSLFIRASPPLARHAPVRRRQGAPRVGRVPARRRRLLQISPAAVAPRSGAAPSSVPRGGSGDGGVHGEIHVHDGRGYARSVGGHPQPQGAAL